MPDTFTQLRYHLVFSTKYRMPTITAEVRSDLYEYLGGVLRGNKGVLLAIGGMPDHVHLLAGWGASISVARMLQLLKGGSSRWMKDRFTWQEGYGAFTVSASKVPEVQRYILDQEAHHRKVPFTDEFMGLLKKHGIDFDPKMFD